MTKLEELGLSWVGVYGYLSLKTSNKEFQEQIKCNQTDVLR